MKFYLKNNQNSANHYSLVARKENPKSSKYSRIIPKKILYISIMIKIFKIISMKNKTLIYIYLHIKIIGIRLYKNDNK